MANDYKHRSTEEGSRTQARCDYKTQELSYSIPKIFNDTSANASDHFMTFHKNWGFFSFKFKKINIAMFDT